MPTLLEWSEGLQDWERDALRRIAVSEMLPDADRDAIRTRAKLCHGIGDDGDHPCIALDQTHLPAEGGNAAPTILCTIGPVSHVDRLAPEQELPIAVDGITLIYGDNGSGKSGYTRIAKNLCQSRVADELRGNVFVFPPEPPAQVRVRYRRANGNAEPEDWRDGQPPLAALARTMVLDAANARAYIDKESEINFLPREVEILKRYGDLCGALGTDVQREAEAITARCAGAYGVGYDENSTAGRLVKLLLTTTALEDLPADDALRDAGSWSAEKEEELTALTLALAQDPRARAGACRRSAEALEVLAAELDAIDLGINDQAVAILRARVNEAALTAQAADLSAERLFAGEPLSNTGSAVWRLLYDHAREFALAARLRREDETFQAGDSCPFCQTPLNEEAVERLRRFDDFVHSRAAAEAAAAREALNALITWLGELRIPVPVDVQRSLAEYHALGDAEGRIADAAIGYAAAAGARRDAMVDGAAAGAIGDLAALPACPAGLLREEAARLIARAEELDTMPGGNPEQVRRATELRDAKRLSEEIDAVVVRRNELALRIRLLSCRRGFDTAAVSRFTRERRKELVTPELERRINTEIERLDLKHIPMRFKDSTDHGGSFFDVVLQTRQRVQKSRVLSEGEQRALGIACFMAECGRIPGNHGIIVDDPVSSLDQQRLRKVAERLVEEAGTGRQVIIFTHNLVFYQEVLAAAAAANPQVPVLKNLISKMGDDQFGIVTAESEPWIAKKVTERVTVIRDKINRVPEGVDRNSEQYRLIAKDIYTDLRETWERLVEEVLLGGVVERYSPGVKTQSLKGVIVEDEDYKVIFAAMKRVSERSGHDQAAGRQIQAPDKLEMQRDLEALQRYRETVQRRRRALEERRRTLEEPPAARRE
jgi:hypothetical protein